MRVLKSVFIAGAFGLLALSTNAFCASQGQAPASGEGDVLSYLQDRVDLSGTSVGIVVGVVDRNGRRIVSYGGSRENDGRPLDGDSIFEIGSVTKVFTTVVLADMMQKGEVQLSDPLSKYLPVGVKVPSEVDREITLLDLATHTSGLPRVPSNAERDMHNPFRGYTIDKAYEFLNSYKLPRAIGAEYLYSNFGMGLLGQALGQRAGQYYEELIRSRVTGPLQMNSTSIELTPAMRQRLVQGYIHPGQAADAWTIESLQGMGALHSTANDLMRFLSVNLGLEPHPLASAMAISQLPRHSVTPPDQEVGLGWQIDHRLGDHIVWHNGLTTGYRSYVGIDVGAQRGVVVLSNTGVPIEDIGRHILDSRFEIKRYGPPKALVDSAEHRSFQNLPDVYADLLAREPAMVATEDQLNQWGYTLLWRRRTADAVAVLTLATSLHPASGNLHESLGEMLEAHGQPSQAMESFRRALAIDPTNQQAKSHLQSLMTQP